MANLGDANLQNADLSRADLRSTNLRGSKLQQANLQQADLKKAYEEAKQDLSRTFDRRRGRRKKARLNFWPTIDQSLRL